MGTNYYAIPKRCNTCGRHDEPIHLGKSSMGWSFGLQANGFQSYKNWEQMKGWMMELETAGGYLEDEYGDPCTVKAFINMVERKKDIVDPTQFNGDGDTIVDGYKFHNYEFS